MKKFNEWLKQREILEVGTCTASVASYSRPIFNQGPIARLAPSIEDTEFKNPKKKKKKD